MEPERLSSKKIGGNVWQVQWMLNLIPDSILIKLYYSLVVTGIVLYLGSKFASMIPFKWIPLVGQYSKLSEILGVVTLTLGAWLVGGYNVEMIWREKVRIVEEQVKAAESKSKEVNTVIQTKIVKQKEIIHDTKVVIQEQIKEVEKRIDADCKLDPVIPKILNDAAKDPLGGKK